MATSRILGPDGQPIKMPDLQTPQTAHLTALQRELQAHPTRGLTPSRLATILDAAEQGELTAQFELFEDMEEKDGHIASEMNKRRRACILEWEVVPPQKSPTPAEAKAAAQLDELLQEIPDFEDVLFDVTDAIGKGFACLEIEWHRVERFWLPKTITHRPQSWFVLHRGYRQELRLRTHQHVDGVPGQALQPFGWLTHVHKAKSGYLERSALFRQLVWTYLFKNYSVGDLAEFLEIYGIPLRVGKYPSSASEAEKLTLLRALAAIGHNAAGIIPEGMLLEFHNAATGDPKAFELMINWCERNQSKVILGATLTSGADGKASTNALGQIHNEVRKDLRDADVRQLNTTLTRDLVYAVAALNGLAPDGPRRSPQFQLNAQETEDLTAYSEALPKLVSIGVQPTVKWAHEKLGIPMPQDGEPVLQQPAQPMPFGLAGLRAAWPADAPLAALAAATPGAAATPPQAMAQQLAAGAAPAVTGWLAQIRALVERAQSLDDIRNGLEQLLPDMTLDQYAAAMAQALAAAQLAGRYEVLQEAGGLGDG
jgi:phage gp29-like protein